jgi:hypothetical protein
VSLVAIFCRLACWVCGRLRGVLGGDGFRSLWRIHLDRWTDLDGHCWRSPLPYFVRRPQIIPLLSNYSASFRLFYFFQIILLLSDYSTSFRLVHFFQISPFLILFRFPKLQLAPSSHCVCELISNENLSTSSDCFIIAWFSDMEESFSNRLVDYFFIVGPLNLLDSLGSHSGIVSGTSSGGKSKVDLIRPDEWRFQSKVLSRYPPPPSDGKDPFPSHLPLFCFPDHGIRIKFPSIHDPSPQAPGSDYHSFVITDEIGVKNYIVCLIVYEKLTASEQEALQLRLDHYRTNKYAESDLEYIDHIQSKLNEEQDRKRNSAENKNEVEERIALFQSLLVPYQDALLSAQNGYKPKCIGFISKWPFYGALRDWLMKLNHALIRAPSRQGYCFERSVRLGFFTYVRSCYCRLIVYITQEIPLPPPGKVELSIKFDDLEIRMSRPPVNCIPVLRNVCFRLRSDELNSSSQFTLSLLALRSKTL